MKVDLQLVAEATRGQKRGARSEVRGVAIDSRRVKPGDLFVALPGQKTDGHAFVEHAAARGASAVLVEKAGALPGSVPGVVVEDTQRALEDLAQWYASGFSVPVIGVTGSTGKTTVKEMLAAALGAGGPVLASAGNYNTEIGVPLTLFALEQDHQAAVLEMAMRGPGQIRRLAQIARPGTAVITNIGVTHMEKLGSREAIAGAKAELLQELQEPGISVLWLEDDYFPYLRERVVGSLVTFGWSERADIGPEGVEVQGAQGQLQFTARTPWGRERICLSALGRHNVLNALAALAAGLSLGWKLETLARGLASYRPPSHRLEVRAGPRGSLILDDSYNANPDSVARGLEALVQARGSGRAIALLGDMLELGEGAGNAHRESGAYAARLGVDRLLAVGGFREELLDGARSAGMKDGCLASLGSPAQAIQVLQEVLQEGDVCLVKASRGLELEKVVHALSGPGGSSGESQEWGEQ